MYGFFDLVDKIKKYGAFTRPEWRDILITILIVTFIVGFKDGRATGSIDAYWFYHLVISGIAVAITVLVHVGAQRVMGLHAGFRTEYKIWYYGLIIGVILAFVTRGNMWLLLPGGIFLHHMAGHRLGFFRYGSTVHGLAMTAFAGSVANILLATFIKTLDVWFAFPVTSILFLDKLIILNWAYALFTLIPVPPLDGAFILFKSRLLYAFIFGSVLGYVILVLLGIYSFVLAILFGGAIYLLYYVLFEKGAWKGPT